MRNAVVAAGGWERGAAGGAVSRAPQAGPCHVFLPIRICFLVFVFSIGFEAVYGLAEGITLAKYLGWILAVLACLQPTVCFRRPPASFWFFAAYLVVYFVLGLPGLERDVLPPGALTLAQNLILFWIASNILRHPGMVSATALVIAASVTTLAALSYAGKMVAEAGPLGRQTVLMFDHNYLGFLFACGAVAWLGLMAGRWRRWLLGGIALAGLVLIGTAWAATGSRGSMVAGAGGILALALSGPGMSGKAKTVFAAAMGATVLLVLVLQSEVAVKRWEAVLRGDTGHRVELSLNSLAMIAERPLLGWGAGENLEELAMRTKPRRETLDTHNDLLWAWTATGLVGGIPFTIGLLLPLASAWKGRKAAIGPLVLGLLITFLLMGLTVNAHKRKLPWVIMGAAVAAPAFVGRNSNRRGPPTVQGVRLERRPE